MTDQILVMQAQLDKFHSDIEKAYGGMDKHAYQLQGICVHDGNAQSGHYFAFIRDRFNKRWLKFNDYRVSETTEEDVF